MGFIISGILGITAGVAAGFYVEWGHAVIFLLLAVIAFGIQLLGVVGSIFGAMAKGIMGDRSPEKEELPWPAFGGTFFSLMGFFSLITSLAYAAGAAS